jgi:MarC family membrane protein
MNLYTAFITLFLIMNPLGTIPVYIATLQNIAPQHRNRIILREAIFAFIILTIFLFSGRLILKGLHVTPSALSVAGGIILFLIAIRLIFPPPKDQSTMLEGEPFLVPLAVPLFAGPATMAMIMLLVNQPGANIWIIFLALLISWSISALCLLSSNVLSGILGKKGLMAMERLMGMILTTIAVQMFLNGVEQYFTLVR